MSCEGDLGFFALGWFEVWIWDRLVLLLIDIVERERETQAACVLAGSGVTWSCKKQRSNASFKRIAKSFGGNVETHGFSSNVRNAINADGFICQRAVSNLRV